MKWGVVAERVAAWLIGFEMPEGEGGAGAGAEVGVRAAPVQEAQSHRRTILVSFPRPRSSSGLAPVMW